MKIFITGIAGFLGSHLADRLLGKGHTVAGCDNLIGGYRENIPQGAEFHEADTENLGHMTELLKGVDVVYHCAATAHEGLSVVSPYAITRNILSGSVAPITAAIQNGVKRFIFCSSMARYGANPVPYREDMEPRPEDPYGVAKFAAEDILRQLSETHGMEYVIAVPHNIIGPRQKYDDPFRNVAAIMINLMLQGRQPIIYGDGEQQRCFSFVEDDVALLEALATTAHPELVNGVLNIGPDSELVTVNELAKTIARLLDFDLDPIYIPDRPREVKVSWCSSNKARRTLGYAPTYTLERGLKEMIDWIRARGPRPFEYHLPLEIVNDKTPRSWKEQLF